MSKIRTIITMMLLYSTLHCQAQGWHRADTELGIEIGMSQYRGDGMGLKTAFDQWKYETCYGMHARYNFLNTDIAALDKRLSLRLMYMHIKESGFETSTSKALMTTEEYSLSAEYNILKYSSSYTDMGSNAVVPYLSIGVCYASQKSVNSVTGEDMLGKKLHFWTPSLGAGLKVAVFNGMTWETGFTLRYPFRDDMDGCESEHMRFTDRDTYYSLTTGLSIALEEMF